MWKAMSPGVVPAGSTVYLRGGTYSLNLSPEPDPTYWRVAGTEAQPTTVRNYPGERAIIEVDWQLFLYSPYTSYIGLEFISPTTRKVVPNTSAEGVPGSITVAERNIKIINCVLHDLQQTTWFATAQDTEMYGNIMYYFGFIAQDSRSWGNAAYVQNSTGRKDFTDNMMFQQFNHNLQVYGSDTARIKDISMVGNTLFNAGTLGTNRGWNAVVWVGATPVERITFSDNYLYLPYNDSSNAIMWGSRGSVNIDLTFTGNL